MSARNPVGTVEFWMQYNCNLDPEPMFSAIAVENGDPDGPVLPGVVDCLNDIQAAWSSVLTADYTIGPGYALVGGDPDPLRLDGTGFVGGSVDSAAAPPNTAMLLKKVSAISGKRGRGRSYVPGLPAIEVTAAGFISDAYAADVAVVKEAILTRLQALVGINILAAYHPCLLHGELRDPLTGDPIPGSEIPPSDLISWTLETKVATQRRRLRP